MDEDLEKDLAQLEDKIQSAKTNTSQYQKSKNQNENADTIRSARAGSEFIASLIGAALLGYGIIWLFNAPPWIALLLIIIGFITGIMRAQNAVKPNKIKGSQKGQKKL